MEEDKNMGADDQQDPAALQNPEERAFTGHPDHPPANPDQPLEGNQELLRQSDEDSEEGEDSAR